jgi:hypothetical protein
VYLAGKMDAVTSTKEVHDYAGTVPALVTKVMTRYTPTSAPGLQDGG